MFIYDSREEKGIRRVDVYEGNEYEGNEDDGNEDDGNEDDGNEDEGNEDEGIWIKGIFSFKLFKQPNNISNRSIILLRIFLSCSVNNFHLSLWLKKIGENFLLVKKS